MKVLVGCEFSGIVRDAFIRQGHQAISCDLLSSETSGPHYQGDIFDILYEDWDLGIFFPPCTHIAVSGARWFYKKEKEQRQAIEFFIKIAHAPIEKMAIENPVNIMHSFFRPPDQIIQPWQFGHGEVKATCFWLKNLPKLQPTEIVEGREARVHTEFFRAKTKDELWMNRSRTYPNIAKAMAEQWGNSNIALTVDLF